MPQPSTVPSVPRSVQLRRGLDALVAALAAVVLLRALLQREPHAVAIALLVVVFLALHLTRTVVRRAAARELLLLGMVGAWAALASVGADAAYASVGLFLVFLTELALPRALLAVVAVAGADVVIGVVRAGWTAGDVAAPVLGAGLSTLIGLGFRMLFDATTAQQRLIEELQRTQAALAEQERAAGQEAERQRLAREIHDTLAQGLSSIQLLLHAAEVEGLPAAASEKVTLARTTAAAGLAEARRLVAELAPADLVGASVDQALQRVCERVPVPVRYQVDGEPTPLPMPVEAALVRIAQGALANVERHAGPAARAVVTLGYGAGRVRMDVVDDGIGFDTAVVSEPGLPAFGLRTIRARVTELGGAFDLDSEPGHTALTVSFPLPVAVEAP